MTSSMGSLERDFDRAMIEIYTRALTEAHYRASAFHTMLSHHGGLGTARRLIAAPKISDGFFKLYEAGHLDLTVEAVIWDNERFWSLFTESELATVKHRLEQYGYLHRS